MAAKKHVHGMAKPVGCSHQSQGKFSRLFPKAKPLYVSERVLEQLAGPDGIMFSGPDIDSDIPAGYAFFGQFVDHDITLDARSRLRGVAGQDVDSLPNFRSIALDLDCLYGLGPEVSAPLYNPEVPGTLVTQSPWTASGLNNASERHDLLRTRHNVALIGDPRNDENIFVAQLHNVFIRFHNYLVASKSMSFEEAQRQVRFHYQYIVLFDYLRRVCDPEVYDFAIRRLHERNFPLCYEPSKSGALEMPVEFSVAAYRFGHSLVRSDYLLRPQPSAGRGDEPVSVQLFDPHFGTEGFSPFPADMYLDWRTLLETDPTETPLMCKAIDPRLADELKDLPFVAASSPNDRSLPFRNLLRGRSLGLPSGQAVAEELKAAKYPYVNGRDLSCSVESHLQGGVALSDDTLEALREHTPLFYYMLAEGFDANHLGKTGSAVLLEVFGGILVNCESSFVHDLEWHPIPELVAKTPGDLQLADLVLAAEEGFSPATTEAQTLPAGLRGDPIDNEPKGVRSSRSGRA